MHSETASPRTVTTYISQDDTEENCGQLPRRANDLQIPDCHVFNAVIHLC